MTPFVAAYLIFSIIDFSTTILGLRVGSAEYNPFAAYLYTLAGTLGILIWKVMGASLLIGLVARYWRLIAVRVTAYMGLGLLVGTCVNNVIVVKGYL